MIFSGINLYARARVHNAFWELLGQIGATLVSILAGGLFVLLLYLTERRDNLRPVILPKKQELEDDVARARSMSGQRS